MTAPATRLIQDSNGVVFAVSKTAQDLFDHRNPDDSFAADNVFAAVNNLRLALANNDQAATLAAAEWVGASGAALFDLVRPIYLALFDAKRFEREYGGPEPRDRS